MVLLLLQLVVIGVVAWLVETYIPMQPPFRTLVRIVVVVIVALWLLRAVGLV